MEKKDKGSLNSSFVLRVSNLLSSGSWIDVMIVVFGALMVNQFFSQLAMGTFTAAGFSYALNDLVAHSNSPGWWKGFLLFLSDNSSFFAPFAGIFTIASGISMVILFKRGAAAIVTAIIFFFLWISAWAAPGIWIFEYLFPAALGICAGFARLPQMFSGRSLKDRLFGSRLFGNLNILSKLILISVSSLALWYAVILSHDGKEAYTDVAWQSALTFGILMLLNIFFDKIRYPAQRVDKFFPVMNEDFSGKNFIRSLQKIPWYDVMIIIIGSMMVIQVYADIGAHWYTVEGYEGLTRSYAELSDAPSWWKSFLWWSSENAPVLMPLQAAFEIAIMILLPLLILRGPVIFLSAGFFFTLMLSEFDVAATLIVTPDSPRTWIWEMMFVTLYSFFISFAKLPEFINSKSIKDKILGPSFFGNMEKSSRIFIALLSSLALYSAGMFAHVFGKPYVQTSQLAGVTFLIIMIVHSFIDNNRKSYSEFYKQNL
jgi:hypothetical protein